MGNMNRVQMLDKLHQVMDKINRTLEVQGKFEQAVCKVE